MGSDRPESTNLILLRRSRPKLAEGDVFTYRLVDQPYRFGRVIRVDLPEGSGPLPGANLVYLYRATRDQPEAPGDGELAPDQLLVPPIFTNRQGWLRGYFQTVVHRPLTDADVLARHCFHWPGMARPTYVDLSGADLAAPIEPCGVWGVDSHRGIDDRVSEALGLPLAPD